MRTKVNKRSMSKESFMQGILALVFSQVLIKVLGLVQTLYLTNRNGFKDAGNAIYMGGYQIYALLLALSSIGVPNAIAKLVSEKMAVGDNRGAYRIFKIAFATFAVIGLVGTLLLFGFSKLIAYEWLQIPEAEYTLMVLSPAIFFVAISSVLRGYFNGMEKMSATANSQTFEQLFKTVLTIVLVEIVAYASATDTALMASAATVATSFAIVLSFIYLFRFYKLAIKEVPLNNKNGVPTDRGSIKSIIKKILAVSIPISVTALLSSVNKNVDSFTVVRFLKPLIGEAAAKEKYGILSAKVDILTSMPLAFNVAFATALVPAVAGAMAKKDTNTANKRLSFTLLLTALIGLPCTVGMMVFSDGILKLLFPNASEGAVLLAISAVAIIFAALAQTINGALQGLGKVNAPAIAFGIGVLVKIVANIFLIPMEAFQENGAAIGSVLCNVVSFIIGYYVLKNTIKLDFSLSKIMVKPVLATAFMSVISYLIYIFMIGFTSIRIATIFAILVAVISYLIFVIIFRIFSKEDIEMLPKGDKIYKFLKKIKIYA
ncbi:MAG: polysaccharide biosynthesis protein [Clostridia bacterium]|nr:polysaccharide biosynthesis protein [Clostridia bacterium]